MPDLEREGEPQAAEPASGRVPNRGKAATDRPVVAMRPGNAGGAKGSGHLGLIGGQLREREEPKSKPKPKAFAISKQVVWEACRRVRTNEGSAGIDGGVHRSVRGEPQGNVSQAVPVRAVEIPKKSGSGVRVLGVPTVADRIAQTVAAMYLEPEVEPYFHPDSYGYRPGRSAKQALERCRERCWKADWVIDIDIKAFFDTIPLADLEGDGQAHTTQVASPLRRAVAASPAPEGGRNVGGTRAWQPAGVGHLATVGKSIHALRVR